MEILYLDTATANLISIALAFTERIYSMRLVPSPLVLEIVAIDTASTKTSNSADSGEDLDSAHDLLSLSVRCDSILRRHGC